jgi:outer membrane protein OmpA-like peptidoglycan-associated protein
VFRVDGDIITLQGTVPDEAAKAQLLSRAQGSYGPENVIDELTVDSDVTFDDGTIRVVGSAASDDDRAQTLQEAISTDFGLANRGFEVGFLETVLAPVNVQVAVAEGQVAISGVLPDEQSITDLVAVANEVWGEINTDAAALTVGDTTWTEGSVRLTGSALSNDQRIATFVALVSDRIGTLVTVDTSGLTINDITVQLETVQAAIDELVAASPIQFEPLSAEIEASSDPTLVGVAELVAQLPSTPFEVVGHTDSVGNDQENLLLSQDRAKAVVARLVELGVAAERMSSRGEGETKPIAENDTDEGKAANRRIEFVLVGTSN